MIKVFFKKNWLIVGIILLAAFLRLYKIGDYMEFLGDQGRDVIFIKDLWKNCNFFFIGPRTSIGDMYLGPFFYYLIAPSLLFANFSPIGPAIFIALLNILTVYLIYYVGKHWFNKKVGLISAFLYSISPVVIKYSNFIWNPNIMPLFSLLFVYLFFEGLKTKKYHFFIYASLSYVMVMNSHYLGLALLPFIGVYWLINLITLYKQKYSQLNQFWKYTLLAIFVFILSLTPQILFDIKHKGQNVKALLKFFTYRESTVNIKAYKAIPKLPELFNYVNTRLLAGKNEAFGLTISIFLGVGLIYIIYKKFFRPKTNNLQSFWIIFFWYISGLIALALYKQHIYDHYVAFLFPSVFLLIGFILYHYKFLAYLLLIPLIYFSLIENPFRYPANHQLKTVDQITDLIITQSSGENFNFAFLAKQNYDSPYRYLLTNKNAKIVDLPNNLASQLFVVCEPFQIDCNPINNPEWSIAAFGWAKIDNQWEIDGNKIYKLIHL